MNDVRTYFDGIAATYDRRRYGGDADPWRTYFFGGRLAAVRALIGRPEGLVVDLGSGPGVLDGVLDAAAARLLHIDISPAMLRDAPGPAVAGDALAIPLRDGTADVVCALGLTTYLPRLGPFLAEVRRVLRPGGLLLFTYTRRASPDTILRAVFRATAGRVLRRGVLGSGLHIRAWSDGEVGRALGTAGFRALGQRPLNLTTFPFCYLLKRPSLALARAIARRGGAAANGLASDRILLAEAGDLPARAPRDIEVVRVIARMNTGGPSRQATILSRDLAEAGFHTTLVTGRVGEHEGDLLPAARAAGVDPVVLDGLGRDVLPLADLRALFGLIRVLRRVRPRIVHTHTAKAGALGRIAAALAGVPVRIHTFHGHVLHGYFGRFGNAAVRAAELVLARLATRLVAVSDEVKSDLVRRHRIAPASLVTVVPLGLELTPFTLAGRHRGEVRRELGIAPDAPTILFCGRVTAVKEPAVLLEVARRVVAEVPEAVLIVAGGGEMLDEARREAERLGIAGSVRFLGWRDDLVRLLADADVALLTSRNEGTPVALIEAAAAGVPAVSTNVGGVPSVVADGETGILAPTGDAEALARGVVTLLCDPELRGRMGRAAKERALGRFSSTRLLTDVERLYRVSLSRVRVPGARREP